MLHGFLSRHKEVVELAIHIIPLAPLKFLLLFFYKKKRAYRLKGMGM